MAVADAQETAATIGSIKVLSDMTVAHSSSQDLDQQVAMAGMASEYRAFI